MNVSGAIHRRRPILVTGSHRSGSTWLGRMLAAADELHYVQEPFNIVAHQRWLSPRAPRQFFYVDDEIAGEWDEPVGRVFDLRYPLLAHLRTRPSTKMAKRAVGIARDAARARRDGAVALVKDPIAVFSTEWLARRFDALPVILVRDPVAFVGSLKQRNWDFDFRHWTDQPRLMAGPLDEFGDDVRAMVDSSDTDLIGQGIVMWNAIYGFVDSLRTAHPDYLVVRYETIASRPQLEVESLYGTLGLRYGPAQRAAVDEMTSADATGGDVAPIEVKRDSRASLGTWRDRLDDDEVDRVRYGTDAVAQRFDGVL